MSIPQGRKRIVNAIESLFFYFFLHFKQCSGKTIYTDMQKVEDYIFIIIILFRDL